MATQNQQENVSKLAAALRRLRQEAESLHRALARNEERAYSLVQNILVLEKSLPPGCGELQPALSSLAALSSAPTESTFLLNLAAQSGVEKLEFEWLANGAALVRVDGGKAFPLPPTVAAFLEALAQDQPGDDERLVGWKSREDIRAEMQKRMGRKFSAHAIEELLRRLRSALADSGVNPYLVQTHRQFGLRFALRRGRNCDEP